MFKNVSPNHEYIDILQDNIIDRLNKLRSSDLKIAFYYDYVDTSTFRYRVHNVIQVIDKFLPECSASWFCYADGIHLNRVSELADIILICRARYSDKIERFINRAKQLNKVVVYDVDDLVVDIKYAGLIIESLDVNKDQDESWASWFGYISRLSAVMNMCDRVTVTNEYLSNCISETSNVDIRILPNFLNMEQESVSDKIFNTKLTTNFDRTEKLHIGYFSGSPSHNKDFAVVADSLAKIMSCDENIHLNLVGYISPGLELVPFENRIKRYPMHDYVNLQALIGSTEINIIPLQDNRFTNCKSNLKFFEAAVVGTNSIATPTYAFANSIDHGQTGILSKSYEWEDHLMNMIHNISSNKSEYIEMATRARDYALFKYSYSVQADIIRSTIINS